MVKSIGYGAYGFGAEATPAVETATPPAPVAPKAAPKKLTGGGLLLILLIAALAYWKLPEATR